jgi:ADP-ribose pyrophosphatase YjhB (NUDIX family)
VGAYAVCVREGELLLARWVARDGTRRWTLPGGGMEHGEHPHDTVLREVEEETGYLAEVTGLLGVDAHRRTTRRRLRRTVDHHAVQVLYEVRLLGGALRAETGGSTDLAAWHPLDAVPALARTGMVDAGLALWRQRPDTGRVPRKMNTE